MADNRREGVYRRLNYRGFLVDIFGALVPGLLFIVLSILALGYPFLVFLISIQRAVDPETTLTSFTILAQLSTMNAAISIELCILVLVASLVVGSVFFRRDPKEPDKYSYYQSSKKFSPESKEGWVVQAEQDGDEIDIQFPYRYLKEYLLQRELYHLAKIVPWAGKDPSTHLRRTKTFINMLKIRLEFYFPSQCETLTKNEAHVRLASSLWYMTKTLIVFSLFGLIVNLASVFISVNFAHFYPFDFLVALSTVLFVLLNSFFAKRMIQDFFHYQRVREIVYVLETAFVASREKPELLKELS